MTTPLGLYDRRKRFILAAAAMMATAASATLSSAERVGVGHPPPPDDRPSLDIPDVPILLQAYVEPIGENEDGSIIELIGPAWKAILGALEQDPDALFHLTPRQMEELVAASYDADGFDEVILTPRSGDFGRDVIAVKHGRFRIRIIDQVKAYSPGHQVVANDVRALSGVLHADPRATKGIVTTTSTFAPGISNDPFIAPLVPYRLELFDGLALTERLLKQRA